MGGFTPAPRDMLVRLRGDPIVETSVGSAPNAFGLAWDGTYFYVRGATYEILVYTTDGTLVRTMTIGKTYEDIDYDPFSDSLLAVDVASNGIDVLNKETGALIETLDFPYFLNHEFSSIAIDRYNNRIYLQWYTGLWIYVMKAGTFELIDFIHIPTHWSGSRWIPRTRTMAIDGVDRSKLWVTFNSFPPMLGQIDCSTIENGRLQLRSAKIDKYRLLGAIMNLSNACIRYVPELNGWYFWGLMEEVKARLYRLSGMPLPRVPPPVLPTKPSFDQDIYRWYDDDDAENPTPKAAEDTALLNVILKDVLRLRVGIEETAGSIMDWSGLINLQYSLDGVTWVDVGAQGSAEAFRYFDGQGVDFAQIANLLLSTTTDREYFVESYPTHTCLAFRRPNRGEFDFCIEAYDVDELTDYYFRAKVYDGLINHYTVLPSLRTSEHPSLLFNLREHKYDAEFDPVITFDKPAASMLRANSTAGSIGDGRMFVVCQDRDWLNGKYIRWGWRGYMSIGGPLSAFSVRIYDGEYDRSSMVDFPNGAGMLVKGAGLLQTLATHDTTFASEIQDVLVDVSAGTLPKCTIFFLLHDAWNTWSFWERIEFFEINSNPGGSGKLARMYFTDDTIHMEVTGTLNDYGYIGTGVVP